MSQSRIHIRGYRPPHGWVVQMWIGDRGYFTCPSCDERTQVLLIPEGELSTAATEQRCDQCVPGLRSAG